MKNIKTAEEIFLELYEQRKDDHWDLIENIKERKEYQLTIDVANKHANQFKPEWVSVEERLPEDGEIVHTCSVNHEYVIEKSEFKYGKFWYSDSGEENSRVTHYMPLPQPPQK